MILVAPLEGASRHTLASADRAAIIVRDLESQLNLLSARMLTGIATRYGKDSNEYEMAGGTRTSDRRRPARRDGLAA